MKKTLLLLLIIGCLKMAHAQQYVINAHITGFPNGTKFYLRDASVDSNIDSAVIQNNRLVMKGKLYQAPQSLWFQTVLNNKFYYANLLIGNEKLTIEADIKDFPFDVKFKGSKTQDEYTALHNLTKENYRKRYLLTDEYFALKGDSAEIKGKQIWKVIGKIDKENDSLQLAYVKANLNSYASLNTLFYLKSKFKPDTLAKMYESLKPEYKESAFGKRIQTYLKVGSILKKGDMATDFAAIDKDGKTHRLSDYKGKYILLDFSATYCGPCMLSIDDMRALEKRYANQLQIITYSADGGKETWLKGVKRDNPTWPSIWDGNGNYGETLLKYGISGYPTFVLVDEQGKIAAKWSGYGKEKDGKGSLETKVDELLAKK